MPVYNNEYENSNVNNYEISNSNDNIIANLINGGNSEFPAETLSDSITHTITLLEKLLSEMACDSENELAARKRAVEELTITRLRELSLIIQKNIGNSFNIPQSNYDGLAFHETPLLYKQTSIWEYPQVINDPFVMSDDVEGMRNASSYFGIEADESAFIFMETGADNTKGIENEAKLYMNQLEQCGCSGICALYDSCSCSGGKCDTCGVFNGGMCAKQALRKRKFPQLREPDGGDYRNVAGDELSSQRKQDENFDAIIRENAHLRVMTKQDIEETLKKLRILKKSRRLEYEWRDVSLNDVFNMYPNINRRETRIEIQMGIYTWMNYRNDIDVHHMEERFGLPVKIVNNYFKDYYGVTFPIFLHKVKSAAAKRLLMIDKLRMNEISEIIGYKSTFHFSVNFKRVEGISPNFYKSLYIKHEGRVNEKELLSVRDLKQYNRVTPATQ